MRNYSYFNKNTSNVKCLSVNQLTVLLCSSLLLLKSRIFFLQCALGVCVHGLLCAFSIHCS